MSARLRPVGFDYAEYLRSDVWRALRRWKLDAADHRCQVCNAPDKLEVHHRTYDNIGNERECDLVVLCEDCHKRHHGIEAEPEGFEYDRPIPGIIANPGKWGQHATRVAEIHREMQLVGEIDAQRLLAELTDIARRRQQEIGS